jgi:Zn-dependent peptidase ImmA (M78 family)/DNA-binding XRE family transcriptional regulator
MIGTVNPNMIILARESRGWNQAELAEKIGMSPTNLSKIERNDIGIQKEVLETIADQTSFPIQFFYQPGTILPENLSYRKRETVAQKLITPINAQINIIRRHIQFLTTVLNIESRELINLPVTNIQTPEKIANKLRQIWHIDSEVIDNMTKTIEDNRIVIGSFDFGTERVDSRTILTDQKLPIIFFNKNLLGDRQRFTLAYEVGQLIMHTFNIVAPGRDISHEANAFAAEFLMPAKYIKEDFKNGVTIPILGELKRKWKVSMIALLYRADDLGFLTPNQKRYLIQQFNQLKIRRREPIELDIPTEEPRLIKRWIADYRSKTKLGVVEMAALLCLNVDEFLELYS